MEILLKLKSSSAPGVGNCNNSCRCVCEMRRRAWNYLHQTNDNDFATMNHNTSVTIELICSIRVSGPAANLLFKILLTFIITITKVDIQCTYILVKL